jgi:rhodanese-related sulfurtransferase
MSLQQLIEFTSNHWVLVAALMVITALLVKDLLESRLRGFRAVGPTEATQLISHEGALVLDIREQNDFADGHIVNSVHIPLSALPQRIGEIKKHQARPIIVGCRTGHRSEKACAQLRKGGFATVYSLKGGIIAWKNANLPITRKKK